MKHPEIFILPVFMLADYFLTIYATILLDRKYREHFKLDQYELNPGWQKTVANRTWFNLRHLMTTVLYTVFFALLFETGLLPTSLIQGMEGVLFTYYAIAIHRHITNILLSLWMSNNPKDISGEVTMSHRYSLYGSMFNGFGILFLLVMLVIFNPTPFLLGGLIATTFFVFLHIVWIAKYSRYLAKQKQTEDAQARAS